VENEKVLMEIKEQLIEIIGKLDKIAPSKEGKRFSEKITRRMNILADILKEGGTVTRVDFHKIVEKNGMDNRGVGGFFIRSDPSLVYIEDAKGVKVALTAKGKKSAEEWIEMNKK